MPEGLDVSVERVTCVRHREPFREKWPAGYGPFTVHTMEIVIAKNEVHDSACRIAGVPMGSEVGVKLVEDVLDIKPACCWLSADELMAAYEFSKVGITARCVMCRRKRLGTPAMNNGPTGVVRLNHLCFHCLIHAAGRLS